MKTFRYILAAFAALTLFAGCKQEETLEFSVDPEGEIVFPGTGDVKHISVHSSKEWIVENNTEWCTVTVVSNNGFNIEVPKNETVYERTGYIRVFTGRKTDTGYESEGKMGEVTLHVTQEVNNKIIVIPDAEFKAYLAKGIDKNGDGEISEPEALLVKQIVIMNKGVRSLTGIEYCTNITSINCGRNSLGDIPLNTLTQLEHLLCSDNEITFLMVSANKSLQTLYCRNNGLTSLVLNENTALKELHCADNKISSIDLSGNPNLEMAILDGNPLTHITLKKGQSIKTFSYPESAKITYID